MGQSGGRLTELLFIAKLYELGDRAIIPEGVRGGDAIWNISICGPLLGSLQRC